MTPPRLCARAQPLSLSIFICNSGTQTLLALLEINAWCSQLSAKCGFFPLHPTSSLRNSQPMAEGTQPPGQTQYPAPLRQTLTVGGRSQLAKMTPRSWIHPVP